MADGDGDQPDAPAPDTPDANGAVAGDGVPPVAPPDSPPPAARPDSPRARRLLLRALAGASLPNDVGEDELDAFPLPGEERAQLPAAAPVDDTAPAETTVEPAAQTITEPPNEAIAAFHREIGLTPAEPETEPEPVAAGGGDDGGDGGDDGPPEDDAPDGNRPPRRRGLFAIEDRPMTIVEHLDELRRRLIWAAMAFLGGIVASFPLVKPFLRYSLGALATRYGVTLQPIAGHPLGGLYATLQLVLVGGLFLGGPVIIYQAVAYVMPALTRRERAIVISYLPASMALFLVGTGFGFFFFEPLAVRVASQWMPFLQGTVLISSWVGYIIGYAVPFGVLYELPVVAAILARLGVITPELMRRGRRGAIMASVVIALMIAPPGDFIFTPTLIAAPLYLLYEVSIWVAWFAARTRRLRQEEDEAANDGL